MKKQVMIASLMALALLVSPLGNPGGLTQVSAEEEPGMELLSVSGNAWEKVQLDAPTNLRWGRISQYRSYGLFWEGVNHSFYVDEGGYCCSDWHIEVYKDDELLSRFIGSELYDANNTQQNALYYDCDQVMNESGSYKFRVQALAQNDDPTYCNSEWSELESITYVRPQQELGSTIVYWDEQQAGLCHFAPFEDTQYLRYYVISLYQMFEDGNVCRCGVYGVSRYECEDKTVVDVDVSDTVSQYGEGKYYVTVQAFSYNIDVVANGKEGPRSEILDTTVNAEKLSGLLSGAVDKSAAEVVEVLKDSANLSSIQQAMQTSDSFREQVRDLETRYMTEQDITVKAPDVSDSAKEYIDPGKVGLVGAAFNAAAGQDVSLQMDITPKENQVPTFPSHKKSVQLDIRLVSGGAEVHDLIMPVSVTMPVPQGIDPSRLVILHYPANGSPRSTAFHVNGDGTITFTVTGFSTFVFAEDSEDAPSPAPGQSASSGSSSHSGAQTDLEGRIAAAAPGATVKVTREHNINALSNSVMQQLVKRGDVTLEMEYAYEGTDYHVIIPAGMAVDDDTSWYGPLYLSAYYSAASAGTGAENSVAGYIVQRGDTLGKIARSYHTTVARLAAANPQIKNVNRIRPGQVINIE